jgi:tungstate transport system substrate-binding protein
MRCPAAVGRVFGNPNTGVCQSYASRRACDECCLAGAGMRCAETPCMTEKSRRDFLRFTACGAFISKPKATPSLAPDASSSPSTATSLSDPSVVRLVSVPTAVEGNVLPGLIQRFQEESGLEVALTASQDVYELARGGKVDLAISHYGHKHAEDFVMGGFGDWPRTLFSNQMALLGPKSDPAKVRGLEDVGEAFRRIAQARAPFVVNDIDGVRYLTEVVWNASGCPDRGPWFIDDRRYRKEEAIHFAAKQGAYIFWGLTPFLRFRNDATLGLEPLVLADPLLQRMLVSVVVKDSKVPGVNVAGATKLQTFLLSPATQARIRTARYPGETRVTWVPGGRHNRSAMLPKT